MNRTKDNMQPIDYAKAACETMMRRFAPEELPPKGHFHYHQGVFLSGVYKTYLFCRENESDGTDKGERYFRYVRGWVDSVIDENGVIREYDPGQLDDIQPGILLYPLLQRTAEARYRKALDTLLDHIWNFRRNEIGGFWHKNHLPNQMWLDGLYMAGPISAEYGYRFGKPEFINCAIEQALLMRKMTEDKRSGLWYHAWDSSREAEWADAETGLAPEFWGRSIGWVPVAVLDELDFVLEEHPRYEEMCSLVQDLLEAVCRYQSEEGRWYQVVDKGGQEGNWLENSCSCLFAAAICKAVRKGILGREYLEKAKAGYEGVIRSLAWEGEDLLIGNVCVGTGVGDYKHYCERPVSVNDLHGVGAFLIMCAEMANTIRNL